MSKRLEKITINTTIDIKATTLQKIVANVKKVSRADEKGIYRIDTAEKVNELISSFLEKKGFDEYVKDLENYTP